MMLLSAYRTSLRFTCLGGPIAALVSFMAPMGHAQSLPAGFYIDPEVAGPLATTAITLRTRGVNPDGLRVSDRVRRLDLDGADQVFVSRPVLNGEFFDPIPGVEDAYETRPGLSAERAFRFLILSTDPSVTESSLQSGDRTRFVARWQRPQPEEGASLGCFSFRAGTPALETRLEFRPVDACAVRENVTFEEANAPDRETGAFWTFVISAEDERLPALVLQPEGTSMLETFADLRDRFPPPATDGPATGAGAEEVRFMALEAEGFMACREALEAEGVAQRIDEDWSVANADLRDFGACAQRRATPFSFQMGERTVSSGDTLAFDADSLLQVSWHGADTTVDLLRDRYAPNAANVMSLLVNMDAAGNPDAIEMQPVPDDTPAEPESRTTSLVQGWVRLDPRIDGIGTEIDGLRVSPGDRVFGPVDGVPPSQTGILSAQLAGEGRITWAYLAAPTASAAEVITPVHPDDEILCDPVPLVALNPRPDLLSSADETLEIACRRRPNEVTVVHPAWVALDARASGLDLEVAPDACASTSTESLRQGWAASCIRPSGAESMLGTLLTIEPSLDGFILPQLQDFVESELRFGGVIYLEDSIRPEPRYLTISVDGRPPPTGLAELDGAAFFLGANPVGVETVQVTTLDDENFLLEVSFEEESVGQWETRRASGLTVDLVSPLAGFDLWGGDDLEEAQPRVPIRLDLLNQPTARPQAPFEPELILREAPSPLPSAYTLEVALPDETDRMNYFCQVGLQHPEVGEEIAWLEPQQEAGVALLPMELRADGAVITDETELHFYARPMPNLWETDAAYANIICPESAADSPFDSRLISELGGANAVIEMPLGNLALLYFLRDATNDARYPRRDQFHIRRLAAFAALDDVRSVVSRQLVPSVGVFGTRLGPTATTPVQSIDVSRWATAGQIRDIPPSLRAVMQDAVETGAAYGYHTEQPDIFVVSIGLAEDTCAETLRSLGAETLRALRGAQIFLFDDNPTDEIPDPSQPTMSETCSLRDDVVGGERIASTQADDVMLTLTQTWFIESETLYSTEVDFDAIYGAVIDEAIQ